MTKRQKNGFEFWQERLYYLPVVRYQHQTYGIHALPNQQFPRVWDISGDWQTNYGLMNLKLQPDRITVTGTYRAGNSNGEINGVMQGTKMVGYWRRLYPAGDRDNAGKIEFRFSDNGYKFDGNWSYGQNPPEPSKQWTGTKISR